MERGGETASEHHHVSYIAPVTFIYIISFHLHNCLVKYVFLALVFLNEETGAQKC